MSNDLIPEEFYERWKYVSDALEQIAVAFFPRDDKNNGTSNDDFFWMGIYSAICFTRLSKTGSLSAPTLDGGLITSKLQFSAKPSDTRDVNIPPPLLLQSEN